MATLRSISLHFGLLEIFAGSAIVQINCHKEINVRHFCHHSLMELSQGTMSEVTLTSFTKQSSMFSIIRWVLLCCYHSHIIKDADMIIDNLLLFVIVKIIVHFGGLSPPCSQSVLHS